MPNEYFDYTPPAARNTLARAEFINALGEAIEAAFDLLPDLQGMVRASYYVEDEGAANAYVITLDPAPLSYQEGVAFDMKVANTNTGASTINANSLGVKQLRRWNAAALEAGDLQAGRVVRVVYDGLHFQLISQVGNADEIAGGYLEQIEDLFQAAEAVVHMVTLNADDDTIALPSTPTSEEDCEVNLEGFALQPGVDFSLSGSTITLTDPVDDDVGGFVRYRVAIPAPYNGFTGSKTHDFDGTDGATTTLAITGAQIGDDVLVTSQNETADVSVRGYVSSENTVTLVKTGAGNPASQTYLVRVIPR